MTINKINKIAIVVDSFSSWNKKETKKLGIFFAPLRITLNGVEYRDGIDMEPEKMIELVRDAEDVKTSAVTPGDFKLAYEEAFKAGFEKVIVLPCTKGFSVTSQNAKLAGQEFGDKIVVFEENILTSTAVQETVLEMLRMIKKGTSIKELRTFFNTINDSQELLVVPKNLDALKRGGRVPKSIGTIMNFLRIIPIINYDGKNHKLKTTRTHTKALEWSLNWIKDKIGNSKDYDLSILCTNSKLVFVNNLLAKAKELLPKTTNVKLSRVSALIAAHTGYESIGLLIYKVKKAK